MGGRLTPRRKKAGERERQRDWASDRVMVRSERSGGDTKLSTLEQEVTAEGEEDERLRGVWELTGRSKVTS